MKKTLYLGLKCSLAPIDREMIHFPIIRIAPKASEDASIQAAFKHFEAYTHIAITSQTTIPLLFTFAKSYGITEEAIRSKNVIAVGKATASAAASYGLQAAFPLTEESAEGMVALLKNFNLRHAYIFWPHSALSRPILSEYFEQERIPYREAIFYDTLINEGLSTAHIDLAEMDEIIFTSPSTVEAFKKIFGPIPWHKQITPIGPVTAAYLKNSQ